ncbi:type II secretion system protein [Pseudomonas sp. R1-18]|uniref:type II secretion system protein n=1 Tax=Pseudomonas sp. R1-18 TaxID=1632772 RepID=UPI003DA987B4
MKRVAGGFGLLEMLAALAIFALGCTVLLVAFGQAARTLEQVRAGDRLSLAIRTVLDEQREQPLQVGVRQGVEGGVDWQVRVSREPGPAALLPLFRVQLTVGEAGRELRVSTLVVQSQPKLAP